VLPVLALILKRFNVHTRQKAGDIQVLYEVAGTPFPDVEISFEKRQQSVIANNN